MPDIAEDMEGLPAACRDAITLAEEFRTQAIPRLGGQNWLNKLPKIQLTKLEIKQHLRNCMEEDELLHLRKLAELGSESAAIVTSLELQRSHIEEAFRVPRHEHQAQITLATILCGTRFKHPVQGILIPTERQNTWRKGGGEMCGQEDSMERLLKCCGLERHLKKGAESITFLVKMGRRAIQRAPGVNIPKYII